MSHACHRFWKCYKTLTFCSLLTRSAIPGTCHAKRHLNVQKWSEPLHGVFHILTSKCASRHKGVHFFDISTSKSGPSPWCFSHFNFEMCFAPQRRALFRHLNFQSWSEREVFLPFSLANVLRATTACTFSTSQRQKSEREVLLAFSLANVLRATTACNFSSVIWPAGSAPAALASLLFDPLETQIIGKTVCFATLLPFRAPGSSFFSLLFSDSSHLCFSSVHNVGSLTSKLPSVIPFVHYYEPIPSLSMIYPSLSH